MSTKARSNPKPQTTRWYRGAEVPKSAIRRFAREVAEQFDPDKIILFGSHAYGKPHADSDVDILVVMPCRNQLDQAFKIRLAVSAPFPMDLIVRKPKNLEWRLKEGESFHTQIVTKGKVLYEKGDTGMGRQSRRLRRGLKFLTNFSVNIRYPGDNATKRQAEAALRLAGKVRDACRGLLGL